MEEKTKGRSLGRQRELMIVVCKKWHVAKRLLHEIRQVTNMPTVEYVFHEQDAGLPDLGGIENSLEKRTRHRRALMRMLFDYFETDHLIVCMDPSSIDLLHDFASDRSVTRILEVECSFSDDDLRGHAMRVGLAGEQTTPETFDRLFPTIRNDMNFESDRIRDAGFQNYTRMCETGAQEANAQALAQFLSISEASAEQIASNGSIFSD